MCNRNPYSTLLNMDTGQSFKTGCNSYGCPECGPRKARKLAKFLKIYLTNWQYIRFWTFTMSNKYHENEDEHWKAVMEVWRRWLIYMRRSPSLRKSQREFEFIRVVELHKSGYVHLHVFVNQYIPWEVANPVWENLSSEICKTDRKAGNTYVKGVKNAGFVANYVCKYITKGIAVLSGKVRRWGSSHGVKIFPKKEKKGSWVYLYVKSDLCEAMERADLLLPTLFISQIHNFTDPCRDPPDLILQELFEIDSSQKCRVKEAKHGEAFTEYPEI